MAEKKSPVTKKTAQAKPVKQEKTTPADVVKSVKRAAPSAKTAKPVSAKKLPSLLKKSYSEKKFEKKLLKKIYITDDKRLVSSFFKNYRLYLIG